MTSTIVAPTDARSVTRQQRVGVDRSHIKVAICRDLRDVATSQHRRDGRSIRYQPLARVGGDPTPSSPRPHQDIARSRKDRLCCSYHGLQYDRSSRSSTPSHIFSRQLQPRGCIASYPPKRACGGGKISRSRCAIPPSFGWALGCCRWYTLVFDRPGTRTIIPHHASGVSGHDGASGRHSRSRQRKKQVHRDESSTGTWLGSTTRNWWRGWKMRPLMGATC